MHCMLMDLLHGFEVLSTTEETLFNSQDQFCDAQNDSSAYFQEIAISQFRCAMYDTRPQISDLTFRILRPFATSPQHTSARAAF